MLDYDTDPLTFIEGNWERNDLPGADRFHGMFTGLLTSCEHSDGLIAIDAFRTAQEQLLVLRLADMIAAGSEKSRLACKTHGSGPLHACLDFIATHSQTQFDLAQMARYAGISLRTAQALFAARLETTISSYLRSHRLDRVQSRLLTEGDATVTSIALEEGFTHLGEFSRWYARHFGEKPSETLRTGRSRRLVSDGVRLGAGRWHVRKRSGAICPGRRITRQFAGTCRSLRRGFRRGGTAGAAIAWRHRRGSGRRSGLRRGCSTGRS